MHISFKYISTVVTILIVVTVGIFFLREQIAVKTWELFRVAELSLFLDPNPELSFRIGNYYFNTTEDQSGVYDLVQAETYFKKTLEYDTSFPWAMYQIARISFLNGNFYTALGQINEHIESSNSVSEDLYLLKGFYTRGLILGYMGRLEDAAEDFLKYIEIQKEITLSTGTHRTDIWAGYNDLAWIYFQLGDFNLVKETTEEGLVYAPNNPWLLNMLGVAYLNLGEEIEAKKYLDQALLETKKLTPRDWSYAYPGNDPNIAPQALSAMITAIETNIELVADL